MTTPRGRGRSSVKTTDISYKQNKKKYFIEYIETIQKYTDGDYKLDRNGFEMVQIQKNLTEWF